MFPFFNIHIVACVVGGRGFFFSYFIFSFFYHHNIHLDFVTVIFTLSTLGVYQTNIHICDVRYMLKYFSYYHSLIC